MLVYVRRGSPADLVRAASPRRRDERVDVAALLESVTKSSRGRGALVDKKESSEDKEDEAEAPAPADAAEDDAEATVDLDAVGRGSRGDGEPEEASEEEESDAPMRKSRGRKFVSGLMHALHLGKKAAEPEESDEPPPPPEKAEAEDSG